MSSNIDDVLVVRDMLFKSFTTDIIAMYTGIYFNGVESIVSRKKIVKIG